MILPVKGPVTSKFGYRTHPVTGERNFHNSIDISCPLGTPIVAPDDGTIIQQWTHKTGGISLAMQNDNGIRFGFAHLKGYSCEMGNRVSAGEIIAYSGNSGLLDPLATQSPDPQSSTTY